jgi:oligopeptide transport system substrate-binding protein
MLAGCGRATPSPVAPAPSPSPTAARASSGPFPVRYYHGTQNVSLEPPEAWAVQEVGSQGTLAEIISPSGSQTFRLSQTSLNGTTIADANLAFIEQWLGSAFDTSTDAAFDLDSHDKAWLRAGTHTDGRWIAVSVLGTQSTFHLSLSAPTADFAGAEQAFRLAARSLRIEPADPIQVSRDTALVLSSSEPPTLDPALTHYGPEGLVGDLFSGLVALDPDMQVRPALAQSWDVSDAGTTYTFHLNPSARFANGRPVTADDVLFSWERAARPQTNSETVLLYMGDIVGLAEFNAGHASTMSGVQVLDPATLRVTIDAPKPYFLAKLTYPVSWVVDRYDVALPNWALHPNGTGPFRHVQHIQDQAFILERNPFYYGEPPRLEHVVYTMYAGASQQLYEDGQVDRAWLARDQLSRAQDPTDGLYGTLVTERRMCTDYVTFDTSRPPFDDLLVRQAFAHAVDRGRFVEAITNGESTAAQGLLPPGMPGYTDALNAPAYNTDLARRLLSESSYGAKGLPPIVWTIPVYGAQVSTDVALLADIWRQTLGAQISLEGIDWDTYSMLSWGSRHQPISLEGWCADYPDPENFLDVLFHTGSAQNHSHYSSPAFDALVEQARIERDPTRRISLYQQAEQILLDDAPALFLDYTAPFYAVWKPYMHGYIPSLIGVPQDQALWIAR